VRERESEESGESEESEESGESGEPRESRESEESGELGPGRARREARFAVRGALGALLTDGLDGDRVAWRGRQRPDRTSTRGGRTGPPRTTKATFKRVPGGASPPAPSGRSWVVQPVSRRGAKIRRPPQWPA
jgi:hypothetical protein